MHLKGIAILLKIWPTNDLISMIPFLIHLNPIYLFIYLLGVDNKQLSSNALKVDLESLG